MECNKCSVIVKTRDEPFIVCYGKCSKLFHADCVGLSRDHLFSLSVMKRKGAVWLCEECTNDFTEWKDVPKCETSEPVAKLVDHEICEEISELKTKINKIMVTLSSITCVSNSSVDAVHHSTPISSRELTNGSNTHYDSRCVADHAGNESERMETEQNFSLLLTNFDVCVREDDVRLMVSQCLGASSADCKTVKKLVPIGVDYNSLDYVSFRIILNEKWRTIAMRSSTWPKSIKFREFVKRQHATWKPDL